MCAKKEDRKIDDVVEYQRRVMEGKPKYCPERKLLLKFLKGRILDIGCNYGDFHKFVTERGKEVDGEVYGLDIQVTNYRENMVKGDAHFLPFKDESFDSVFAGEIIEHLHNPTMFLREIERVLKKGGIAIITTPNIHSLVYIRKSLLGKNPSLEHSGHIYAWDLILFKRLIRSATKMKIIECVFADPEGINKIAILIHRINPKLSWFLYVVLEKGL